MTQASIDLYDPETLVFDSEPDLFVLQHCTPIIFTVRGLQYFSKRFKMIGIDIATLDTQKAFRWALMHWIQYETQ